jgi:alanine racemase
VSRPSERPAARAPRLRAALETLRPTRALVDLDAIAANHAYLSERARGAQVLCVVKADAYGHGAVPVALRLEREGASWFGVALLEEGLQLRRAGVTRPILLLGGGDAAQLPVAIDAGLTPVVVSHECWRTLHDIARARGTTLSCHLKVDTGMTRLGIPWTDFDEFVHGLGPDSPVRIDGLFTHLASSDDPAVPFTRVQLDRFRVCRDILESCRVPRPLLHVASSAGLLTRAEEDVDIVRPGVALYGLNPFGNVRAPELTPALTVISRVVRVATVPAGTSVGYGCTFITVRESRIATVPMGYEDGLPRLLGDAWEVAVGGKLAPLVGRVSMDLVTLDVTDAGPVGVGDEVTIVGAGAHPVEEMARRLRTIPYEVTCGISSRVPRCFVEGGEIVAIGSRFGRSWEDA